MHAADSGAYLARSGAASDTARPPSPCGLQHPAAAAAAGGGGAAAPFLWSLLLPVTQPVSQAAVMVMDQTRETWLLDVVAVVLQMPRHVQRGSAAWRLALPELGPLVAAASGAGARGHIQ
eukprot:1143533-Pelagomonas_calceolata.AAC.7